MIVAVSSLGVGGVGKSTIALALAVELSRFDITLLLESTGYLHKLLDCPHVGEVEHRVRMIGNLAVIGVDNSYVKAEDARRWITQCCYVIEHLVHRKVRHIVLDLPAAHEDDVLSLTDVLFLVQRPYACKIREFAKIGHLLRIGTKLVPIIYVINFWPGDVKLQDGKKLRQILGIDPEDLQKLKNLVVIPELDVRKSEKSILTVAKYIVEKGLLRKIVEKLRLLES